MRPSHHAAQNSSQLPSKPPSSTACHAYIHIRQTTACARCMVGRVEWWLCWLTMLARWW
jgi:hypothetical protein